MSDNHPETDPEDSLWADSADRRTTLRALDEHRAEEHLTDAEHDRRRDLAQKAQTLGELRALFADLPAPHPMIGVPPQPASLVRLTRGLLLLTGGVIVVGAVLAGWWVPALLFAVLLALAIVFTSDH